MRSSFDLPRLCGSGFYESIMRPKAGRRLELRHGKVLRFVEVGGPAAPYRPPVVEYLRLHDGSLVAIELEWRDISVALGSGKLADLCATYVGIAQSEAITPAEKGT